METLAADAAPADSLADALDLAKVQADDRTERRDQRGTHRASLSPHHIKLPPVHTVIGVTQ